MTRTVHEEEAVCVWSRSTGEEVRFEARREADRFVLRTSRKPLQGRRALVERSFTSSEELDREYKRQFKALLAEGDWFNFDNRDVRRAPRLTTPAEGPRTSTTRSRSKTVRTAEPSRATKKASRR